MNIRKTLRALRIVDALELVVAFGLLLMVLLGYSSGTVLMFVLLVPLMVVENLMSTSKLIQAAAQAERADSLASVLANEEQLNRRLRAQRHDFLNHLQVVYTLLELEETVEAAAYLKEVYTDLKEMGQQLRTADPAVNALLAAKSQQAQQRNLDMVFDIRTSLQSIALESWELCRVLANLLDNAMDAAEGRQDGWVKLSLWEDVAGLHFSVTNNGPMIPKELLERIFTPGFTTKEERGTGMGLYIIRSIVQQAGGKITCGSSARETCFVGWIPPVHAV